jgi:hypothetical protein
MITPLGLLGVGLLSAVAACGGPSIEAHDQDSTQVQSISELYKTSDPKTLVAAIDESTTDQSSYCWAPYRFIATVKNHKIYLTESRTTPSVPAGQSCTMSGVNVTQKVHLPISYRQHEVVDASTGKRIRLTASPANAPTPIE